jgi:hypothetical protein
MCYLFKIINIGSFVWAALKSFSQTRSLLLTYFKIAIYHPGLRFTKLYFHTFVLAEFSIENMPVKDKESRALKLMNLNPDVPHLLFLSRFSNALDIQKLDKNVQSMNGPLS